MHSEHIAPLPSAREISPEEYWPIASEYLRSGRRKELWHVNHIKWDGELLSASARLDGYEPSKTDDNRFHLSIFAAREMEAQLAIIGLHLKMGLSRKTTEVWVLSCQEVCSHAITQPDDVRFNIRISTQMSKSGKIIADCDSRISDMSGGEIKLIIKRLMPLPLIDKG